MAKIATSIFHIKNAILPDPNKAEIVDPLIHAHDQLTESRKLLARVEPYMDRDLCQSLRRDAENIKQTVQTEMDSNSRILAKPLGVWWFKIKQVKSRVQWIMTRTAVITGQIKEASDMCMVRAMEEKIKLEAKAEKIELCNRVKQGCLAGAMLDLQLLGIGEAPSNSYDHGGKLTTHQAWIQLLSRMSATPQLETVSNTMPSISSLVP
ncbi:hypothetical protein H0H93_003388 [Arthromyces matolae]|nr:hypothetical protein H0H93_003388 [Arthromyces matolae]